MASSEAQYDSDDGMDAFMDKFKTQRYKNAFSENNWEEVRNCYHIDQIQRKIMLDLIFTLVSFVNQLSNV